MSDIRTLSVVFFAFVLAVIIAAARPPRAPDRSTVLTGLITVALQAAHFFEELQTGLYVRFPEFFGLDPFTREFFVAFNTAFLLLWLIALASLKQAPFAAGTLLWFLAVAAILNAVLHPAMALATGGYFPGLYTSLFVGIAGGFFARSLLRAARPPS